MKQSTHDMYKEARAVETPLQRKEELDEIMTRLSEEIPVPDGAVR